MRLVDKTAIDNVDWTALAALIAAGGLNARAPEMLEQSYRNSTFCWFGYHQGKLIATAHAISDLTWSSYLADVVIDPAFQGKGYGKALMANIVETLLPFGKIFIYSVADKTTFYQHHGFEFLTTGMVCTTDESLGKMRQQGYIR